MKVGDLVKPGRMQLLNCARIGIIVSIHRARGKVLHGTAIDEDYALVMWSEKSGIFTDQISQERLSQIERVINESR